MKVQVYAGTLLLNEITGTAEVGLNTVHLEHDRAARADARGEEGGPGRRAPGPRNGLRRRQGDPNFASFPVQPGEYTVVLTVDGKSQTTLRAPSSRTRDTEHGPGL